MTVYFSATAAARDDQRRRTSLADGLRHRGLAAVDAQLARPATTEPPTFREIAARHGWSAAADRVNRWSAAGYRGDWRDPEYDLPSPADAEGDQP